MRWRLIRPPLETLPNAPDLFAIYRHLHEHPDLERAPGGWNYRGEFYPDYLTVGGAGHAIFRTALKYCRGAGLDVGAGHWPLPGATPVDTQRGEGRLNAVEDFADASMDFVFSSHCLEHIEDWGAALKLWIHKLKPGGGAFSCTCRTPIAPSGTPALRSSARRTNGYPSRQWSNRSCETLIASS